MYSAICNVYNQNGKNWQASLLIKTLITSFESLAFRNIQTMALE